MSHCLALPLQPSSHLRLNQRSLLVSHPLGTPALARGRDQCPVGGKQWEHRAQRAGQTDGRKNRNQLTFNPEAISQVYYPGVNRKSIIRWPIHELAQNSPAM